MNVARSTFMRKGYLLTALAVAVLLGASSGTAWAQTIGFTSSRGTLEEGASTDNATPAPLKVTISRSGNFDADDGESDTDDAEFEVWVGENANTNHVMIQAEYEGSAYTSASSPFIITARSGDDTSPVTITPGSTPFGFKTEASRTDGVATRIELTIQNSMADPGDWNDETLVLKVVATSDLTGHLDDNTLSYRTQELTVTVTDDDPTPKLRFGKTDIQLAKGNTQTVTVGVGTGARGTGALPLGDDTGSIQNTLSELDGTTSGATGDDVVLSISPADAVGRIIKISKANTDDPMVTDSLDVDSMGRYIVGKIGGDAGVVESATGSADNITLTIEAIDVTGFRDEMISLTLLDGRTDAEKKGEGGPIDDSVPATVTVLSGEETPTVTFSTDSISIDEGDSETVHLLAGGMQGDEVGSVTVAVRGDADISLEQNGSPTSGLVSFGGNANAELTIISNSDPSLEDGEEKTATVTITDASGAIVGDPGTLTVTVVGSTAVPVLPLFAQLLLALLLMVGGARLYRRRQG